MFGFDAAQQGGQAGVFGAVAGVAFDVDVAGNAIIAAVPVEQQAIRVWIAFDVAGAFSEYFESWSVVMACGPYQVVRII